MDHGARGYWGGCRCLTCRTAQAAYRRALRRQPERFVAAEPVRQHLHGLQRAGWGKRRVARASGVSIAEIGSLRRGCRTKIRLATADRILAVSAKPIARTVSAWWVKKWIGALLAEGYTRRQIATALGRQTDRLRFGDRVRAVTAAKVERLYRRWVGEDA